MSGGVGERGPLGGHHAEPLQLGDGDGGSGLLSPTAETVQRELTPRTVDTPTTATTLEEEKIFSVALLNKARFMVQMTLPHFVGHGSSGVVMKMYHEAIQSHRAANVVFKFPMDFSHNIGFHRGIAFGSACQAKGLDTRHLLLVERGELLDATDEAIIIDDDDKDLFGQVMELSPFGGLDDYVWKDSVEIPTKELIENGHGIVKLVADLASIGALHLDIKPGNVLIFKEGDNFVLKMIDFDGSAILPDPGEDLKGFVEALQDLDYWELYQNQFFGTTEYLPPREYYSLRVSMEALFDTLYDDQSELKKPMADATEISRLLKEVQGKLAKIQAFSMGLLLYETFAKNLPYQRKKLMQLHPNLRNDLVKGSDTNFLFTAQAGAQYPDLSVPARAPNIDAFGGNEAYRDAIMGLIDPNPETRLTLREAEVMMRV